MLPDSKIAGESYGTLYVLILDLRRLEHTRHAHGSSHLLFSFLLICLFLLLQEQLSVIAGELLQRDQEVTEGQLEAVNVVMLLA